LNKREVLEAILEADAAGYAYIVEETSCLRQDIKPLDTFLSVKMVSVQDKKENYKTQSTDTEEYDARGFPRRLPPIDTSNPGTRVDIRAPGGYDLVSSDNRMDPSNADAQIRPPIVSGIVESEVVRFVDQNPGTVIDYATIPDDDQYADIQPSTELAEFLSRPVLIDTQTYDMSTSAGYLGSFNPWALYFSNSVIKNKLQNYAYLSCKLHVKTLVNCSPFYYGNVLYAYLPCQLWLRGPLTSKAKGNIQGSQLPHYWVYPQSSQGGELVLPFFWHKTYMDITDANGDPTNIGAIKKWAFTTLRSANGAASGNATLQTYAWATDVRLHAPTIRAAMQTADYQQQSSDEYGDRYISKTASAVATALGYLSTIPEIGVYATASSMVMSTVGKIAYLFGFTNTPNLDNVDYFKPTAAPHFASSDISVPFDKFSLDPKTELSIDPSLVGLNGTDELNISYLCQKESYLTSATWTQSDAVDSIRFAARVTPNQFDKDTAATPNTVFELPVSYISRMFQFWRGDLIFRFRFICSPYHKGRVRISFDPRGDITNNSPDYSAIFNEVIDIGTVQDVEIRVPYMQTMPWLGTNSSNFSTFNWATTTSTQTISSMTYSNALSNGLITLRVVTPLTAPVTTADVTIQVFVRGADNFELGVPAQISDYSAYKTQSSDCLADLGTYDNPMLILAGNAAANPPKSRYLMNFGENVVSLRKLLRRTVYHSTVDYYDTGDNTGKLNITSAPHNRIPSVLGYDTTNGTMQAKGIIDTATTYNCNIVKQSAFTWLYPCFGALRGSFNWHHVWYSTNMPSAGGSKISTGTPFPILTLSAGRTLNSPTVGNPVDNNQITLSSARATIASAKCTNGVDSMSTCGMALQAPNVNNCLSFVAPNYNQYKMNFCVLGNSCGSAYTQGQTGETGTINDNYTSTILSVASTTNSMLTACDRYFSVGTDFNFLFFICTPPLYSCDIGSMVVV